MLLANKSKQNIMEWDSLLLFQLRFFLYFFSYHYYICRRLRLISLSNLPYDLLSIRSSWGTNRFSLASSSYLVVDVLAAPFYVTTFLFDLCAKICLCAKIVWTAAMGWYSLPAKWESVDDEDDAVCCCWSFDNSNAFLVSFLIQSVNWHVAPYLD
jgi:hypothetical protein